MRPKLWLTGLPAAAALVIGLLILPGKGANKSVSAEQPRQIRDAAAEHLMTPEPTLTVIQMDTAVLSTAFAIPAAPTSTPDDTPVPATPTPIPTATPRPVSLEEATVALNAVRRPNRLKSSEIEKILATLPADLSISRTMIVMKAYSLLDKVPYQYGGKSRELGWDATWKTQAAVISSTADIESAEAEETATPTPELTVASLSSPAESPTPQPVLREVGLDCSGFVRWCFNNASGTTETGRRMGSGTYKQWINSTEIKMEEAMPGDLVFTNKVARTNHDGIVVSNDGKGKVMVIHCAKDKGVVLERADKAGFKYARRPDVLRGKIEETFDASTMRHRNESFMADLRYVLVFRACCNSQA